jgi:molybdenum cofactor biosynthesis enzyme MoaA
MTEGADRLFGKHALAGAQAGYEYGMLHKLNTDLMKKINDREWLDSQFNE